MPFDRDRAGRDLDIDLRPIIGRPRNLGDYNYVRTLSKGDWAWEFLRRNRDYQRDYRAFRAISPVTKTLENDILIIRQSGECPAAERWGCPTFADPAINAPCRELFWRQETGAPSLTCIASESLDLAFTLKSFAERGVALSVLMIGDKQYLRASRGSATLMLAITGASIFSNVRLSFQLPGCAQIGSGIEALRLFKGFLVTAPSKLAAARPWTARGLALRDAVVALDGYQAGASYREMAVVHFGEERVAAYWRTNSALKDKMRRALARGIEMRDGGYRALLNGEWR